MADMAPCNWPLFVPKSGENAEGEEVPDSLDCGLDELSEDSRMAVIGMATDLLWNWTGRKFGTCEVTVYPCRQKCPDRLPTFQASPDTGWRGSPLQEDGWVPLQVEGEWWNVACGVCPSQRCTCSLRKSRSIVLPGPVEEITAIWLNGVEVSEDDYLLRDGVLFLKESSGLQFPSCNTPGGDVEEAGSGAWSISYMRGYPVPLGGQLATYRLACELADAVQGRDCALPSRVSSITRQGVSMAILDDFQNLDEGRTGIWEIDSWLSAVNQKREAPPVVWSPDMPLGGQRGTSAGLARGGVR